MQQQCQWQQREQQPQWQQREQQAQERAASGSSGDSSSP